MKITFFDPSLIKRRKVWQPFRKFTGPNDPGQILHRRKGSAGGAEAAPQNTALPTISKIESSVLDQSKIPGRPQLSVDALALEAVGLQDLRDASLAAIAV